MNNIRTLSAVINNEFLVRVEKHLKLNVFVTNIQMSQSNCLTALEFFSYFSNARLKLEVFERHVEKRQMYFVNISISRKFYSGNQLIKKFEWISFKGLCLGSGSLSFLMPINVYWFFRTWGKTQTHSSWQLYLIKPNITWVFPKNENSVFCLLLH